MGFVRGLLVFALLKRTTSTPAPSVTCSDVWETHGGLALYIVVVMLVVAALGIICEADFRVGEAPGRVRTIRALLTHAPPSQHCLMVIAAKLHLSDDVAGATFMAAGNSSAELFLSLFALLEPGESDDTGAGTIVGSAIFNVAVTIGLAAAFSVSDSNTVDWKPVARDLVANVVCFCWVIGSFADGRIMWWEALIGVLLYVCYALFMWRNKVMMQWLERRLSPPQPDTAAFNDDQLTDNEAAADPRDALEMSDFGTAGETTVDSEDAEAGVRAPDEQQVMTAPIMGGDNEFYAWHKVCGKQLYRLRRGVWTPPTSRFEWVLEVGGYPFRFVYHYTIPNAENPTWPAGAMWLAFLISLVYLGGLTLAMIVCCQKIGCLFGMDEAVTGATLLAVGASLPDAMTSVFVSRAGKADMAVSNVLGSNVFDVLVALGLPWLLMSLINGAPVLVNGAGAVIYTSLLFGVLFCFIGVMVWRRWHLDRACTLVLFSFYAFFLAFSIMHELRLIVF